MSSSLEVRPQVMPTRAPLDFAGRCRFVFVGLAVALTMTITTVLMVLTGIVTLFRARRFYTEVLARRMARIVLWFCGVRLVVHPQPPLIKEGSGRDVNEESGQVSPDGQVVYISNHTSTLDCIVLLALDLPNSRFFLSGFLRKNPLICIMGYLMGTIWTVPQSYPQKRAQLFERAERILRRTGESVYLSPEGERIRSGQIGHFNKGAFHLATNLQTPLAPFYIAIPAETDPGMGFDIRPGVVQVYFQPTIPTRGWRLQDLEQNRTMVRDVFVRLHEELKPS